MVNYILLSVICVLTLIIICRYTQMNYQMMRSIKLFKKYQEKMDFNCHENLLHICVPCLREQSIIEQTISELLKATNQIQENVEIYIVTTQKENYDKERYRSQIYEFTDRLISKISAIKLNEKYGFLFSLEEIAEMDNYISIHNTMDRHQIEQYILDYYYKKPSTNEVVEKYIVEHPSCNITLLNYPNHICSMASQLNYCYRWILENKEVSADDYFMVYNADCQPNPNTFKLLFQKITQNKKVRVFQLIRAYTLNYDKYIGLKGFFLKASALYQTRWSLGSEYPMYERYYMKFAANNQRSYYMIGHGMTFSLELLKSINGFHETTNLEDLYIGYVLSYCREKVIPIPALENTLNPLSVKSWAKQKIVWFAGMYDVFNYPTYIKENVSEPINKKWANKLRFQFFFRDTLPWLLGPTSVLLFIILSLIVCKIFFYIGIFLILINSAFCGIYLLHQLKKLNAIPKNEYGNLFGLIAGIIIYSLLRNLPSIYYVINRTFNKSMEKFKTER